MAAKGGGWRRVAQGFGIDEEERLVLPDGPAYRSCVEVGHRTCPGRVGGVIEKRIGVEDRVVVVIDSDMHFSLT